MNLPVSSTRAPQGGGRTPEAFTSLRGCRTDKHSRPLRLGVGTVQISPKLGRGTLAAEARGQRNGQRRPPPPQNGTVNHGCGKP
jgi:hypothetical protein